ncbi:ParB/RepB/Spo0J family partition protein [Desertimonas flava]|uniref:ParB/RepB/Spo0J family partition protein n=1 Tax=Desertimonas flava TaxID=2064846 RepID=UPI000E3476E5|nr:ParB/RepB/Spo0J family partition protein [Desertimonas flava]
MPTATDMRIVDLPVDQISPECNDRTKFDETAIVALAESIARNGLAQPITVRPRPDSDGYWLVAGERRWRAHRHLGASTIKAIVRDLDDRRAQDVMLVENMARQDLNPIEEATAYRKRLDAGLDIDELAKIAGVSVARIRWRVGLLELTPEIQKLVASGDFGPGYAGSMPGLDPQRQQLALRACMEKNLTVQGMELLCAQLLAEQNQGSMFDADSFMQLDEVVAKSQRENVKLSSMELTALAGRVLDAVLDHVPLEALSHDAKADLDQLQRVVAFRLKK